MLEGRVVQDVWIMPRRADRTQGMDKKMNMYGTTLVPGTVHQGVADHVDQPRGRTCRATIGRRVGDEIVQIGHRPDGTTTRWRFTEITKDSFHWLGESLNADGTTWTLEGEFRARRMR